MWKKILLLILWIIIIISFGIYSYSQNNSIHTTTPGDYWEKEQDKNFLYRAFVQNNEDYCNQIIDKELILRCYSEIALKKHDSNICENLATQSEIAKCRQTYKDNIEQKLDYEIYVDALRKKDLMLCQKIITDIYRGWCINQVHGMIYGSNIDIINFSYHHNGSLKVILRNNLNSSLLLVDLASNCGAKDAIVNFTCNKDVRVINPGEAIVCNGNCSLLANGSEYNISIHGKYKKIHSENIYGDGLYSFLIAINGSAS